jgi:beta-glucosidase
VIAEWNGLANAIVMTSRGGKEVGPGHREPALRRLPTARPAAATPAHRRPGSCGPAAPTPSPTPSRIPYDLGATAAERADIHARIDAGQPIPHLRQPAYPYGAGLQAWP